MLPRGCYPPSLSPSHSPGDGVQIGAEAVVKVCVGLPYLLQHLDVQGELKKSGMARIKSAVSNENSLVGKLEL